MALNPIGLLTKGVAAALPYFTGAVALGMLPSEIIAEGRTLGLSYNTQQAYEVINYLVEQHDNRESVSNYNADQYFKPFESQTAITDQYANYNYLVEASGIDLDTGERVTSHVTIASEKELTIAEVDRRAKSYWARVPINPNKRFGTTDRIAVEGTTVYAPTLRQGYEP